MVSLIMRCYYKHSLAYHATEPRALIARRVSVVEILLSHCRLIEELKRVVH